MPSERQPPGFKARRERVRAHAGAKGVGEFDPFRVGWLGEPYARGYHLS